MNDYRKYISKPFLFIILLSFCHLAFALQIKVNKKRVLLGKTPVTITIYQASKRGLLYFRPHEDEVTSLQASKAILKQYGGKIIDLVHIGTRLISFKIKNNTYIFDPNRIFTTIGIKKTLIRYGKYSQQAQKIIQNFSKIILSYILPTSLIIAVHNNHHIGYSIRYYMKGGIYEKDVKTMYLNPNMSLHSFVFVTTKSLFDFFKAKKINVILQDNANAQNDGSLSYYAGKKKYSICQC